jgi:hypothetical protein
MGSTIDPWKIKKSMVSSILRRVLRLKKYDRKIKSQIGKIQDNINKSQRQT